MAMKNKTELMARATMRLPQSLWDAAQHRAIDEHVPVSKIVAKALTEYLKKGAKQ